MRSSLSTVMYRAVCAILFLVTPMVFAQSSFVNTLMPLPREVQPAAGAGISITPAFTIAIDAPPSDALEAAVHRFRASLQNETGIYFTQPFQPSGSATLTIKVASVAQTIPSLHDNESYTIDTAGGTARITAATLFGAYDALQTMRQLAQPQGSGFLFPSVHIEDSPRFPWRGLLIDTGRHFYTVASILRTLDGMAAVKLNVLHFHLTEDQGFRIESKLFPKLTGMGSLGLYYTQDQIRMIVAYAAARGIRVVPEFDMPGHSTSWFVGYPDLASGPGPYHVEDTMGIHDAAMDPTRDSTYKFIDAFLGEMTQLFPDAYIHIGGDESNGKQWRSNPEIVAFMKSHHLANTKALQVYFNHRLQGILKKHDRKMVGWDEVLQPNLSPEVVVEVWHGNNFLINAAKEGHSVLYSHPYYLDHTYSAEQMFLADPIPADANLSPQQQKLILGGEACMWGEFVNDSTADSRIWPRAAAVAERLWSPQQDRGVDDMYRRLHVESLRLDGIGLEQISGPERLLRQLADKPNPTALRTLASTLSPLDLGVHARRLHPLQDAPLTSFDNATVFDPPLQHNLAMWVDQFLQHHDAATQQRLTQLFQSWITASGALDVTRPQLQSLANRRTQLGELGQIGLRALAADQAKQSLSAQQFQKDDNTLEQASMTDASMTNFIVIAPLRKLLAAAQQQ